MVKLILLCVVSLKGSEPIECCCVLSSGLGAGDTAMNKTKAPSLHLPVVVGEDSQQTEKQMQQDNFRESGL